MRISLVGLKEEYDESCVRKEELEILIIRTSCYSTEVFFWTFRTGNSSMLV